MKSISYARVDCSGNELKYIAEVLNSGWLTTAGKTFEFEKKIAEMTGAKFACAVNSCTAALHLAVDALGIGSGDKVLVPSMTFTASAEVLRYVGADPVFLDVEYNTALLSPEILEAGIRANPEAKAVIIVHFGGQSADMDGIIAVCRKYGIKIIEDAAHAFPTRYHGKMIGGFGDLTCFSFYANKTITTGEGGMITGNDEALMKRIKIMRLHGINRDIWNRFTSNTPSWEYDVVAPGFKYNLPDIASAIGLAQLERAEEFRQSRQRCAQFYYDQLNELPEIDLPSIKCPMEDHSWHIFPIILNDKSRINRNRFIELMAEAGIGTSVHYKPLYRMTYYRDRYGLIPDNFVNTERIWRGCVSLPIYGLLSQEELNYICANIKAIMSKQ